MTDKQADEALKILMFITDCMKRNDWEWFAHGVNEAEAFLKRLQ